MGTMNQTGCMGNCGKMDSEQTYITDQPTPYITNPMRKMGFEDPPANPPKPTGQLVTAWTQGISSIFTSAGGLIGAIKSPSAKQQQDALAQQQALLAQQGYQPPLPPANQPTPESDKDNGGKKTGLIIGIVVVVLVLGIGIMAFSKT